MQNKTNTATKDDQSLLKAFFEPCTREEAFNDIVKIHQQMLYWHIRRLVVSHEETEDLLQETFYKAYRNLDRFNGFSSLKTWLYKIATNECLSFIKKKKRSLNTKSDLNAPLVEQLKAETILDSDDIEVKFHEAILRLPPQQQLVFHLRYYDDLSYEEIKHITGSTVATLKTNYHYAFHKLKNFLTEE
jgi:RNA polymerase sigma-70 factor (ECF subfamily)